ncbi:MAG: photosystem I reaction center subunit XII [Spirulina sp. SIO3F2]|nr:photosystem I reaction center subunit XII [Spirulina sp. SIO3F2]
MALSDTQIFVALILALLPGVLAYRLSAELYK